MRGSASAMRALSLGIGGRLAVAFSVLIFLLAAAAAAGAWQLARLETANREMATTNLRLERLVGVWSA